MPMLGSLAIASTVALSPLMYSRTLHEQLALRGAHRVVGHGRHVRLVHCIASRGRGRCPDDGAGRVGTGECAADQ